MTLPRNFSVLFYKTFLASFPRIDIATFVAVSGYQNLKQMIIPTNGLTKVNKAPQ